MKIAIAGCGALGSWLSLFLARPGQEFYLVDDDRVGPENIATTAFMTHHVGAHKAIVISEWLARRGLVTSFGTQEITDRNLHRFSDCDLILDCLDNSPGRALLASLEIPVLHAGVSPEGMGSVIWNHWYIIPDDGYERGENPVCTHLLNRQLLLHTAIAAATVALAYLDGGQYLTAISTRYGFHLIGQETV